MKTAIFTTLLVLISSTAHIFAADAATFAVGANTTSDGRVAVEFGAYKSLSFNTKMVFLVGGTPVPKKSRDLYGTKWYDTRITARCDLLVRPWQRQPLAAVLGVYAEYQYMVDSTLDTWDYQRSLVLAEIGADWQFSRNWAIQLTYRTGISFPSRAPAESHTAHWVGISIYGWIPR